ncbi:MAG: TRZ/ATZ family hydrolase [Gammaproteobacteria bacterium]|nr:TRZ/ATZ family hydrolase [Gammaproteobacteria bacterium]
MQDNSRVDTLIEARWVIPATANAAVLENHAVAIKDKRITSILPIDQGRNSIKADQVITLAEHALIPGLINAHGHAPMSLFRGIADDLPLKEWLEQHIWPLETEHVTEEFAYQGAELAIAEMLLGGTTCFADMYFFPDAVARAASNAHIRVQLASPILDFPTVWGQGPEEYIQKATALHDVYRNSELVYTAFGPHATYTVSDAPLQKISILAEELDIPIHMHIHETAAEVEEAVATTGKRPLERLADLGLISPRLLAVHGTQLSAEEMAMLNTMGAHVIHCPESNLKLASGFCEVAKLMSQGVNVALGTDGCASNNDLDMFSELRTAALLAKAVAKDASALPAYQALQMATINGARALGLEHSIGSIETGKFADLTAVRLDTINALPLYNPVSHLVYNTRSSQVSHVWVGGRAVVEDGNLLTLERRAIQEMARHWQHRIKKD